MDKDKEKQNRRNLLKIDKNQKGRNGDAIWEIAKRKMFGAMMNIASTRNIVPIAVEIPFEFLKNFLSHET